MENDARSRTNLGAAAERTRILDYERVLDLARILFLEGSPVDMNELARRLSVSRATLYRVASSRERLLGDVIWSLSVMSLRSAAERTEGPMGLQRILDIGKLFRDSALASEAMKRFVAAEPSTAATVLHTRSSERALLVYLWRDLLTEATTATNTKLNIHPMHAAEIVVNLGASTLYDDLVSGEASDPDLVAVVLRSLFRRSAN